MDKWGKMLMKAAAKKGGGSNGTKGLLVALFMIPIFLILFVVIIIQSIFQFLLCSVPFLNTCGKGDKETLYEQAITETEIKNLAEDVKGPRKEANEKASNSGGQTGQEYGSLKPGGGVNFPVMSGPFIDQVKTVIHTVESGGGTDYAVINQSDVGGNVAGMTIGKYQQTGSNAAEMLILIRDLNPTFFNQHIPPSSKLGTELKTTPKWDYWANRRLQDSEVAGVKAVLTSPDGIKGQEEYMSRKVSGYIGQIQGLGITDPKAQCYISDIKHQSAVKSFANYIQSLGTPSAVTIDIAHQKALSNTVFGTYKTRRNTVYQMCSGITGSIDDSNVVPDDKDVPTGEVSPIVPGPGVIAELADGVFPLPKGQYESFIDSWGYVRPGGRTHEGADIMAKKGVPIYSATNGTISATGWLELGGYRLNIDTGGYTLYYAHLSQYAPNIAVGRNVSKGELIGYVGDTGYGPVGTTGQFAPHLHFGIYPKNQFDKALNPFPTLKHWEGKGGAVSGGEGTNNGTTEISDDEFDEAEIHLRTLIQIDEYALVGMNLTEKDLIEGGKYADTFLGDAWKLANDPKVLFYIEGKIQDHWGLEDKIMNARMIVYQCYLVGEDDAWGILQWFADDPCEIIDNVLGKKNYISLEHQGMLRQLTEQEIITNYCVPNPPAPDTKTSKAGVVSSSTTPNVSYQLTAGRKNGGAKNDYIFEEEPIVNGPSSCGANETLNSSSETVYSVRQPDLVQILKDFKPYSLADTTLTTDKEIDGEHADLVDFYLNEMFDSLGIIRGGSNGGGSSGGGGGAPIVSIGSGAIGYPVTNHTSQSRGWLGASHKGIDYAVPRGTPVYAAEAGRVVYVSGGDAGPTGYSYGNLIIIEHVNANGARFYTKYGHILNNIKACKTCMDGGNFPGSKLKTQYDYYDANMPIQVKKGDTVVRGQLIAYVGNAGQSTGFHLHFELATNPNNFWSGMVNPAPYFK